MMPGMIASIESPLDLLSQPSKKPEQEGAAVGVTAGGRVPSGAGGRGYLPRSQAAWRSANVGHVSLDQLKVMSAIERWRSAAMWRAARTVRTP